MNLIQPRLLQVMPFFTILIMCHINDLNIYQKWFKWFNQILLNCNEHNQKNKFLNLRVLDSFTPLILKPIRITSLCNTLISNIFYTFIILEIIYVINQGILSGNLTAITSDHLPQFSIISIAFGNISGNESNIYKWDWSKFDLENFILDYCYDDW